MDDHRSGHLRRLTSAKCHPRKWESSEGLAKIIFFVLLDSSARDKPKKIYINIQVKELTVGSAEN